MSRQAGPIKSRSQLPAARQRILNTAYVLFARLGVKAVGVDTIVARSGVAKMTLYRHFPSKEHLALAFLEMRDQRWTVDWLKAGVERGPSDPAERLLLIFDLFDEWFQAPDFEGCSFIKVLLESAAGSAVHEAAGHFLIRVRAFVTDLATEACIEGPADFGAAWHMLMEGSIVSACSGNRAAALEAKRAATLLLSAWPRKPGAKKTRTTKGPSA